MSRAERIHQLQQANRQLRLLKGVLGASHVLSPEIDRKIIDNRLRAIKLEAF